MISYMINIYDKYIFHSNKTKYILPNDGALTRWRHHANKCLHNPIAVETGLKCIG